MIDFQLKSINFQPVSTSKRLGPLLQQFIQNVRRRKNQRSTSTTTTTTSTETPKDSEQNQIESGFEIGNFPLLPTINLIEPSDSFSNKFSVDEFLLRPEGDDFSSFSVEETTTLEPETTTVDEELTTTTNNPTTTLDSTTLDTDVDVTTHSGDFAGATEVTSDPVSSHTTLTKCCCAPVNCDVKQNTINDDSSTLLIESIQSMKEECSEHKSHFHALLDEIKLSNQKLDDMDLKIQSVNDQIANVYEVLRVYILPPTSLEYLDKLLLFKKQRMR